ncbi:hypothetical protein Tco_1500012 [Tanacetum coccineum]
MIITIKLVLCYINTNITSHKALDSYSSKNYLGSILPTLHTNGEAKVIAILKSRKELMSYSYELTEPQSSRNDQQEDSEIGPNAKVEKELFALKAKKESTDRVIDFVSETKSTPWSIRDSRSIFKKKICLGVDLEPEEWIKDSGCSKYMTGNRKLFSTYKEYNGGNVIFGSNLRGQICDNKCRVTFSEHDSEITKDGKVIGD